MRAELPTVLSYVPSHLLLLLFPLLSASLEHGSNLLFFSHILVVGLRMRRVDRLGRCVP